MTLTHCEINFKAMYIHNHMFYSLHMRWSNVVNEVFDCAGRRLGRFYKRIFIIKNNFKNIDKKKMEKKNQINNCRASRVCNRPIVYVK